MQKRSPDRSAGPLRWLGAALTGLLPTPTTPAQITKGLSLWLDEKRGSRHALFFAVNDTVDLQVNVENLLDEDYFASANSNNNITPGSPRAFRVALTSRF